MKVFLSCNILLYVRVSVIVMKNLVLVAEDVIVYIVLLGGLWSQYEGLHEATHWLAIVRQFPSHLIKKYNTCLQIHCNY